MIWVADRQGDITFMSPEWVHITGKPIEQGLGKGWRSIIHEDDLGIVSPIFSAAVRAKSGLVLQYRLRLADCSYIWVISGAVPSLDADGVFIGYLGSVTMIEKQPLTCLRAGGRLGKFDPPHPHKFTLTQEALGLAADHLLMAHALIAEHPTGKSVMPSLEQAMRKIAFELARSVDTAPMLN